MRKTRPTFNALYLKCWQAGFIVTKDKNNRYTFRRYDTNWQCRDCDCVVGAYLNGEYPAGVIVNSLCRMNNMPAYDGTPCT